MAFPVQLKSKELQDARERIAKLEQENAELRMQLAELSDPAGSLLKQLGAEEYRLKASEPLHGYYALYLKHKSNSSGVIYIGHQRAGGGRPAYADALKNETEGGGPRHAWWRQVPCMLQTMYDRQFRIAGPAALVESLFGVETLLTRLVARKLGLVAGAIKITHEYGGLEVVGGLYALHPTSEVETAFRLTERHDDNRCTTCGEQGHWAHECEKEPNLKASLLLKEEKDKVKEEKDKVTEANRKAEAAGQAAQEKLAELQREVAAAREDARAAREALTASRGVGEFAKAAPAPATPPVHANEGAGRSDKVREMPFGWLLAKSAEVYWFN